MNKIIALLFIASCLVSAITAVSPTRPCVDGKSYNDGCNTCTCMGGNTACTLMACRGLNGEPLETKPPPDDFWQN